MRPAVTYTPYATSSKEQTGDVITFAQFEEGNLLNETRNDTESDDASDSESIMMSERDMENLGETEKFDEGLISTQLLQDIFDGNQTHPEINKREARMAIRDHIKQNKSEWKGALRATHKMGKGFTPSFQDYCIGDLAGIVQFWRNWFRSGAFYTRTQKLCRSDQIGRKYQKTLVESYT